MSSDDIDEDRTDAEKDEGENEEEQSLGGCHIRNITHPLRYYEFTQEEIKALEECDKESFYQRCLPFSGMFAASTYTAIKYGYLNRSPHWGAVPKVAAALAVGHLVGRLAYLPHCERKLRDLPPTSYLGNVIRDHYAARNPPPPIKDKR